MEKAVGKVLSLADSTATVSVDIGTSCARCRAGKGCGAALLQDPDRRVNIDVTLPADSAFAVGDSITLAISPAYLLRAAMLAYGLPLAGMLVALALARMSGAVHADWQAVLYALGGLAVGLSTSRRMLKNERVCRQFVPELGGIPGAHER
jgi:sigma-E factor negative regulatory protein RseC